jgi:hypothetical protein
MYPYRCIYGYICVYFGCGVGFQKRESQPSRAIFMGAQLEILFQSGHWAFITWRMFKEEQPDVGRGLAAMLHVK